MTAHLPLSQLPIGSSAVLRSYPRSGAAFLRLRELGLLPGVTVTVVRAAPLGDPLEIRVRGFNLSLRRSEAEHVLVDAPQ